jgi:hypothetical protein
MHALFYSNIKPFSVIPLFFVSPHPPNISPLHCSFLILFLTTSATPLHPSHHPQVLLASAITIMHSTAPVTTCIKKIHFVQVHVTLKLFALGFKWLQSTFAYTIHFADNLKFSTRFTTTVNITGTIED